MKTNVIVKLQVEGLHNWPDAAKVFPEVAFRKQGGWYERRWCY